MRRWLAAACMLGVLAGAEAQSPGPSARIGYITYLPLETLEEEPGVRAFRQSLAERGWIEGKNVTILWRSTRNGVIPVLDELVRTPVDVLVVPASEMAIEAMKRTPRIPIVVRVAFYPVEAGLAESRSRPGRNVTGLASNTGGIELNGKQLALLKETAPQVSRVVYLTSPLDINEDRLAEGGVDASGIPKRTVAAARALGITLTRVEVRPGGSQSAVESALALQLRQGMNGLFVDSPEHQRAIVAFAQRHRVPAIYTFQRGFELGGLMYYGVGGKEQGVQLASFADRILRGASVSEIPFEAPRLTLSVNRTAAKAIGLALPQSIVTQADRVVD